GDTRQVADDAGLLQGAGFLIVPDGPDLFFEQGQHVGGRLEPHGDRHGGMYGGCTLVPTPANATVVPLVVPCSVRIAVRHSLRSPSPQAASEAFGVLSTPCTSSRRVDAPAATPERMKGVCVRDCLAFPRRVAWRQAWHDPAARG